MKFYLVNEKYLNFLRTVDKRIMYGSSYYNSESNKFILGVVFSVNNIKYYAPISSIKDYQLKDKITLNKDFKKTSIPIIIERFGEDIIASLIRFDYMFPVPDTEIKVLDIGKIENIFLKHFITKEFNFVLSIEKEILKKAESTYSKAINPKHFLYGKCCDFKALEIKYQEWLLLTNIY